MYPPLDRLFFIGSAHQLVRNTIALYVRWWHRVVGATCTATYISEPTHCIKWYEKERNHVRGSTPLWETSSLSRWEEESS